MYKIYEIKMGDTLDSIAKNLGVSPEVLATLNGLNVVASLTPGTYIVVPSTDILFDKYTVKNGDTIYAIARNYNLDPNQLLKLNGLDEDDYIYAGEAIMLPKQGTKFYVTNEGDTLNKVTNAFGITPNELANQNPTIYLDDDQLIVYKKS